MPPKPLSLSCSPWTTSSVTGSPSVLESSLDLIGFFQHVVHVHVMVGISRAQADPIGNCGDLVQEEAIIILLRDAAGSLKMTST